MCAWFLLQPSPLQDRGATLKHFVSLAGICYGRGPVLPGVAMKPADRPNLRVDFDRLWSSLMELG
uniref:hypothetical protein n=1 Tax=Streptomyces scabiei TaxID=1930 RepID=UPI0038F76B35